MMILSILYLAAITHAAIIGCEAFAFVTRHEAQVGGALSSNRLSTAVASTSSSSTTAATATATTAATMPTPEFVGGFDSDRMDALTQRGILEANLMQSAGDVGTLEEVGQKQKKDSKNNSNNKKKKKKKDIKKKKKGPSTAITVRTLDQEGVVRLNNILSSSTASTLREEILTRRNEAFAAVKAGDDWRKYFADVLLKTNRCDLLLPLENNPALQNALFEMLVVSSNKKLPSVLQTAMGGDDATLYELSALISEPGSPRQPVHPDNPYQDQSPLYTVFIALQDVTPHMGPTVFLPRTNTAAAHDEYNDVPRRDAFLESRSSVAACLNAGDASLFDSRTMHAGGANDAAEGATRVLLYMSFRNPRATEPIGNVGSLLPGIEKMTLRNLRSKLAEYVEQGKEDATNNDDDDESGQSAAKGGFGSGGSSSGKSKSKSKGQTKKTASNNSNKVLNLFTPEGRMDHVKARIAAADISPVAKLALTKTSDGQLALDIDPNAMAVVDNFLGKELITAMRAEAESLLPTLVPSQSTRWDEETRTVVPYEKKGVFSTQIEGGTLGYEKSPRLVEYIVTLTAHLSNRLNQMLPDAYHLAPDEQTNKLAVCLGDGSYYDKHIDNLGGTSDAGDRRKLTALLYLQPPGSHDGQPSYPHESVEDDPRGGYFRAYDVPEDDAMTCIAPRGDRLIMFWSDSLVHDVSPSFSFGDGDRRWALTIWFTADKKSGVIRATDVAVEEKHFGSSSIGKG